MASIELKVSTDEMRRKAMEFIEQTEAFENSWERLAEVVEASSSYWIGDSSDTHLKYLAKCEVDVERILKRLGEHPRDLMEMAGIYDEVEELAKEAINTLPDDALK